MNYVVMVLSGWWTLKQKQGLSLILHASEEESTDGHVGHHVAVARAAVPWSLMWRNCFILLGRLNTAVEIRPLPSVAVHTMTSTLSKG